MSGGGSLLRVFLMNNIFYFLDNPLLLAEQTITLER